jgi:hypothetical protein
MNTASPARAALSGTSLRVAEKADGPDTLATVLHLAETAVPRELPQGGPRRYARARRTRSRALSAPFTSRMIAKTSIKDITSEGAQQLPPGRSTP